MMLLSQGSDSSNINAGIYQLVDLTGKAPTDGFLLFHRADEGHGSFTCYIDRTYKTITNSNGAIQKVVKNEGTKFFGTGDGKYGGSWHLYTIPIKKGSTWEISGTGIDEKHMYFMTFAKE